MPNFFIDKFRIPPFLLPIYQAAGMQYGVRWEILAAINEIETDYGRNLNISSAGALGWMQFMPPTWAAYGVDANGDGVKDPFNPVDAIFAAARYLRAAGADSDIRRAVFAYNHADWYVDSVLMRAQVIGGLPSDLVGSLTGLTQGRFPIHAKATYAGQLDEEGQRGQDRATRRWSWSPTRPAAASRSSPAPGRPVIAVNDGRVVKLGRNKRLGKLRDAAGRLRQHVHLRPPRRRRDAPTRRRRTASRAQAAAGGRAEHDARPRATRRQTPARKRAAQARRAGARATTAPCPTKERLFAHPSRPAARAAGGDVQLAETGDEATQAAPLGFKPRDFPRRRSRRARA